MKMDDATRKAKAEQLAALMNELDVSLWAGTACVSKEIDGPRVVMQQDFTWQYVENFKDKR
jgi:hypothetical protein